MDGRGGPRRLGRRDPPAARRGRAPARPASRARLRTRRRSPVSCPRRPLTAAAGRSCCGRWAVAAEDSAAGADGGDGAVGVKDDVPSPGMDHDQVVEQADEEQVVQGGGPAFAAGDDVVRLAYLGWLVAAGEAAALV